MIFIYPKINFATLLVKWIIKKGQKRLDVHAGDLLRGRYDELRHTRRIVLQKNDLKAMILIIDPIYNPEYKYKLIQDSLRYMAYEFEKVEHLPWP